MFLSPLSKKSLPLKSKVNELGKAGFSSYTFHRVPAPLRKIPEHLCDSVSSVPKEKTPPDLAGKGWSCTSAGVHHQQVQLLFLPQQRWAPLRNSASLEGLVQKKWFLLCCDGKSVRDFALRHFRVVSEQLNVSFISCTTVRAGLILSEPSPSMF